MTRSHVGDAPTATVPGPRTASVAEPGQAGTAGPMNRFDRVRWSAVWMGALTVLPTYLVLQMLFFAAGWLDFAVTGNTAIVATVTSAVLGLVAFFIGGLTAGASVTWRGAKSDGILNGIAVWALTVVILLGLGLLGAGAIAGPLGQMISQAGPNAAPVAGDLAVARQVAGWTALAMGLSAVAAAMGAGVGTKKAIWSPKEAASTR